MKRIKQPKLNEKLFKPLKGMRMDGWMGLCEWVERTLKKEICHVFKIFINQSTFFFKHDKIYYTQLSSGVTYILVTLYVLVSIPKLNMKKYKKATGRENVKARCVTVN